MIVEDAAHATMHLAVGDVEIIVRPLLESRIMLRVMGVAGPLHRCVEICRVVIIGNWRVANGPAAEPALRRCKKTRVNIHGREMRIGHMRPNGRASYEEKEW